MDRAKAAGLVDIDRLVASEYGSAEKLVEMIQENLIAERIAIDHYRELIRYFGDRDPGTRKMLEDTLIVEEEHANDMHDLLDAKRNSHSLASTDLESAVTHSLSRRWASECEHQPSPQRGQHDRTMCLRSEEIESRANLASLPRFQQPAEFADRHLVRSLQTVIFIIRQR